MNIEEKIEKLCKIHKGIIVSQIETPIIADGFQYDMHKQFNNEIIIQFPINMNKPTEDNRIVPFIKTLEKEYNENKNIDWIEHFYDDMMTDFDELIIWWNEEE